MARLAVLAALMVVGCGAQDDGPTGTDASALEVTPDAPPADAAIDAPPETFSPCSERCPDEEWFPWRPNGVYLWSYCLPSYNRCDDPAQH